MLNLALLQLMAALEAEFNVSHTTLSLSSAAPPTHEYHNSRRTVLALLTPIYLKASSLAMELEMVPFKSGRSADAGWRTQEEFDSCLDS